MLIDLPQTMEGSTFFPSTLSYLHNMYNVNGHLLCRDGYTRVQEFNSLLFSTGWKAYALFPNSEDSKLFCIFGEKIFKIRDGDSFIFEELTITNDSIVRIENESVFQYAIGFTGVAFTTGSFCYFLNTSTEELTLLNNPLSTTPPPTGVDSDFPDCKSVTYIDGRYVWCPTDGGPVVFSEVNDSGNIEPLSFFDAETRTDLNERVCSVGSYLYVMGSRSIEPFRNVGPSDAPFIRSSNSIISIGFLGGLIELSDRVIFIGRRVGGGISIYELSGSSIKVISNDTVNELLNVVEAAEISAESISNCTTQSWESYGRDVYSFSFNRSRATPQLSSEISFCCMVSAQGVNWSFISDSCLNDQSATREWGIREFRNRFDPNIRPFGFISSTYYRSRWYALRSNDIDDSGVFEKASGVSSNQDTIVNSVEGITRGVRSYFRNETDQDFEISSIEMSVSQRGPNFNQNPINTEVNIRVSETGINLRSSVTPDVGDWSINKTIDLSLIGSNDRIQFRGVGGLIKANRLISIVLETTTDAAFNLEKVILNA